MTTICLVRHGETDWNRAGILQGKTDIPLNSTGKRQAEACGNFLKRSNWDVLITSPLKRAKETATIIQQEIHNPIVEREEFIERGYGKVEGLLPEERDAQFPDKVYPDQETIRNLTSRVKSGIEWIHHHYFGKHILLVTHGDVIHTVLAEVSPQKVDLTGMNLSNACLSEVQYINGKWEINYFNEVGHLSEK